MIRWPAHSFSQAHAGSLKEHFKGMTKFRKIRYEVEFDGIWMGSLWAAGEPIPRERETPTA
jgi:hypothetical protein